MRRALSFLFACTAIASLVAACDVRSDRALNDYGYSSAVDCRQLTSCGACTPQNGCGWCASGAAGLCVDDPRLCPGNEFTFTWEPSGCPGYIADASVSVPEASATDTGGPPVDAPGDTSDAPAE